MRTITAALALEQISEMNLHCGIGIAENEHATNPQNARNSALGAAIHAQVPDQCHGQ